MSKVFNNQGFILTFKRMIPERIYRKLTKPVSWTLRMIPNKLLYTVGMQHRKKKYPYSVIEDGDVVVQMGAPRDLIVVGRSRAVFFMNCVGKGKVIIFEPDPDSANAMRDYVRAEKLEDRILLIEKGAWSKDDTLTFLSSPEHPAANLIKGTEEIDDIDFDRRQYNEIQVPVTSLDNILKEHNLPTPKLVSITTNGAESEILEGMKDTISAGLPYISLAVTGGGYPEMMADKGYKMVAYDDRGFTFDRKG